MQTWMIYEGNALKRLHELPNDSIHCGVGSPPYWGGLRNYLGNPEQLGHEPHPRLYALDLADIMDVVKDKLRPEGTFWLNLGDSYIGSGGAGGDYNEGGMKEGQDRFPGSRKTMGDFEWADPLVRWAAEMSGYADYTEHAADVRADMLNELLAAGWSPPSKLKLTDQASAPWECAMELRQRGWWLRCDVIWHKKNVKPGGGHLKRPTIDHEYLFQLCKSEQTYYDSFAVKVPAKKEGELRNRRSVWHIGVSTWKGAHFATFPPELVDSCIKASSSEVGVCPECGAPWRRLEERTAPSTFTEIKAQGHFSTETLKRLALVSGKKEDKNAVTTKGTTPHLAPKKSITVGWAMTCQCGYRTPVPALVLDPFAGAGSAAIAALKLGRSFVGVELEAGYVEMIEHRLRAAYPNVVGQVMPLV
jgi:site-specific DNA-methyltransferase (cytosine-N4-specific)